MKFRPLQINFSLTLIVACIKIECGVNYDPLAPDPEIHLISIRRESNEDLHGKGARSGA